MVRLWTLKEAYSKALGQGLRFRFTEFGFGLDVPWPAWCGLMARPRRAVSGRSGRSASATAMW